MKKVSIWMSAFVALILYCGSVFGAAAVTTSFNPNVKLDLWHFKPIGSTAYTGTSTSNIPVRFTLPSKYKVIAIGADAETITVSGGNSGVVDILLGGVSILSTPINITAQATSFSGTVATSSLTKEGILTIAAYGSGSSPSVADLNVWMYVERTN